MKNLLTVLVIAVSTTAFAQSTMKEDGDIIQGVYGKSKKELVMSFMYLTGTNADAFWKLYDEYETERKALGHQRVALIDDYAKHYETFTDAKADELAKGS